MNQHHRDTRKIDPTRGATLGDNTPNNADRVEIGPTQLAFQEWAVAGLDLPDLQEMRRFRWTRLTQHIVDRGYGGLLLFDPLNIRYATDSTNMQLWNTHNPFRAVLLCADGHMVIWDYKNSPFLSEFNPLVKERRKGASMFYFANGDTVEAAASGFADQVGELMREHAGRNTRLAVDKIMIAGYRALTEAGFDVMEGEELTERARSIKGPDEIKAMRCASHACEAAVYEMEKACEAGRSEDEIWSVLHAENIKRGGEWIETRLLASGPRSNPWFQECGARIVQPNEIVSWDSDLIGAYGICVDISRSWWVGPGKPRPDMIEAMKIGREHIDYNMNMLKPGVRIEDLIANCHPLPEKFQTQKYSCLMHGVGLCDEWPLIPYKDKYVPGSFDHELRPGMTLCVEALISEPGKDFSIKLEDQVLITETGFENLTKYPFDPALCGH